MEDVRNEWERIKLSYEILSDKQMRMRYDRHESLAHPGAAMSRAAWSAVGWGLSGIGKSVWKIGEVAIETMATGSEEEPKDQ